MLAHVVDMAGTSSLRENRRHRQRAKTKSKRKAEDKKKKKEKIYIYIKIEALTCVLYLWDCLSLLTSCVDVQPSIASNEPAQSSIFFPFYPLFFTSPHLLCNFFKIVDCSEREQDKTRQKRKRKRKKN